VPLPATCPAFSGTCPALPGTRPTSSGTCPPSPGTRPTASRTRSAHSGTATRWYPHVADGEQRRQGPPVPSGHGAHRGRRSRGAARHLLAGAHDPARSRGQAQEAEPQAARAKMGSRPRTVDGERSARGVPSRPALGARICGELSPGVGGVWWARFLREPPCGRLAAGAVR
jgi:hypothetical protein